MRICSACGHENSERAKFCQECAAPLAVGPAARELRKTVTVLFCDVAGSTALGESIDPEALRALLARYFERMKGIVEEHGGTVEKFIGDAVMAVFGVPVAARGRRAAGLRAAVEMREALPELGVAGADRRQHRRGGDRHRGAARDRRRRQRRRAPRAGGGAGRGADRRGDAALVRDAVEAEPVRAARAEGEGGAGARLPAVSRARGARAPARRRRSSAVSASSQTLATRLASASRRAACQLFTVRRRGRRRQVAAGGRVPRRGSRPASCAAAACPTARGSPTGRWSRWSSSWTRCPPIRPRPRPLRSLLGESGRSDLGGGDRLGLPQAARGAQERPLVCVFDDLHWGEETFLDLVEHVAAALDAARRSCLLCMARPELLERRPGEWPVAAPARAARRREPIELLDIPAMLDVELRERITARRRGQPAFLHRDGRAGARSPRARSPCRRRCRRFSPRGSTSSRPESARVLERGAVEGEVFHRGAVQALCRRRAAVSPRLASLVRKEHRPSRHGAACRRGGLPLPAPPDPGRRLRRAPEGGASRAARALCRLARAETRRHGRAGRDRRLPPGAGRPLQGGARTAGSALAERAGERLRRGRPARACGGQTVARLRRCSSGQLELLRPTAARCPLSSSTSRRFRTTRASRHGLGRAAAERAQAAGDHVGEALALVVAASRPPAGG